MKAYLSKYKIESIVTGIGLLIFVLLFFAEFWLVRYGLYWEGRGIIPFGSGFLLLFRSIFVGVPFFVAFVVRLLIRVRKDRTSVSFARLLLGIGFLVAPPWVCAAAIVLPMPREPGMVRFSKGFRDRIDRRCSPEEIRLWAESFLENNTGDDDHYELAGDRVPPFVKEIYPKSLFGKRVRVSVEDGIVKLWWGSPLPGHWGLYVGPQDMVCEEGLIHNGEQAVCFFKWKPGICIWYTEN